MIQKVVKCARAGVVLGWMTSLGVKVCSSCSTRMDDLASSKSSIFTLRMNCT